MTSACSKYLDGALLAELEDASVSEKRAYEFARIFRLKPTRSDILPSELMPNTPAASTSLILKPLEFETTLGEKKNSSSVKERTSQQVG